MPLLTPLHPVAVVVSYHAAVKKKRLDLLDKANNNKGPYQQVRPFPALNRAAADATTCAQYYTKRLLEMEGDPAYDSYSQRDKDRKISNSWLVSSLSPPL